MFSSQETEGNRGMLLEDHSESRLVRKEKRTRNCAANVEQKEARQRLPSVFWPRHLIHVCIIWTMFAVQMAQTHTAA